MARQKEFAAKCHSRATDRIEAEFMPSGRLLAAMYAGPHVTAVILTRRDVKRLHAYLGRYLARTAKRRK